MTTSSNLRNFGGRKYRLYKGETLYNATVTYKIDGVRAVYDNGSPTSRAGKMLYNLPTMKDGHYEVFTGSFKDTIQKTRTHNLDTIPADQLYSLSPIDARLVVGTYIELSSDLALELMSQAQELGYEGLVIFTDKYMYKVKPEETFDVVVTGVIPGAGKHLGRMGALTTEMGDVGTGFTYIEREQFTEEFMVNQTIEVSCMMLTPDGKFRHARFCRLREDK